MVIDKKNLDFRKELADDLTQLKVVLNKVNIEKKSIDTLDRAIKSLKDSTFLPSFVDETDKDLATISTPCSWGYGIKDFILMLDLSASVQYPKKATNALLQFSIDVVGEFDKDQHPFRDPFKGLEFNIVIKGLSRGQKEHIFSYHLDRDLKGKNPPNEIHPGYHFHYGGRKMKDYTGKNFGSSLILDMPRLMHYPMDFIIGLDFITSNFKPDLWRTLRKDAHYIKLIRNAQSRVMKPYFGALAHHFGYHAPVQHSWKGVSILPQIL